MNGPEDVALDWEAVDWRQVEGDVQRLRQRIFTASKAGDLKKVRNLQKLMLRSRSNALLSVRRVTEVNAGRLTAGVDGKVVTRPEDKMILSKWMQQDSHAWKARPVRRVYIPKANGRKRPLGIPVIVDRALQALAVNALEPEWEARFEPKSYGFRPGRGCHDAIEAIFTVAKGKDPRRQWVLDADLTAAFDRISHDHLLQSLGTFPGRGLIAQWLTAGVMDGGQLAPTTEGTPQGGVISPLLMNVALHGIEEAAGVCYKQTADGAVETKSWSPILVRYADDLVVLCHTRDKAEQAKAQLAAWLAPRGLSFNEDKTRVVSLDEGCDFLGFNIRRYGGKLLIKPSRAAQRRVRERLTAEMRGLRGSNAAAVLTKLNPIIRGWATYYRTGVSSRIFQTLDPHVWRLTYSWAKREHPKKSKHWIKNRYFGRFHPTRQDQWVFGDRATGRYLIRFSWISIVRHTMVTGGSSPDDPALAKYWVQRRNKKPAGPDPRLAMLKAQRGLCPLCGDFLLYATREPQSPQEWEQWLRSIGIALRSTWVVATNADPDWPDEAVNLLLLHRRCRQRYLAEQRRQAPQNADTPPGLA
ncbi:group II intron reverse transcriptase/maturase [Longispora sp. K20-0274]|uniref:group II intron reverse transcriptase/maturase n=1 Tax=Longispora sp. K20-0274 TaxID=3088255 RepID=UPI00399BD178